MGNLQKLLQLFAEGVVVDFDADTHLWVNKLSPFQQEQVLQEARVARARRMLAIKEIGTPEHDLLLGQVVAMNDAELVDLLVSMKGDENTGQAVRDMNADEEWRERIEVMQHSEGVDNLEPEDTAVLVKIVNDYQSELLERQEQLQGEYRATLKDSQREDLIEIYEKWFADTDGFRVFSDLRRRLELYYCMRECSGGDHKDCNHTRLFLADRSEVVDIPEQVRERVTDAFQSLSVPPDLARFMAGPASSSESSGPSSSAEGSSPSGQEQTSPEPDPT